MTSRDQASAAGVVEPMLTVAGPGGRRRRLRLPFLAATLFFTIAPLLTVLADPPAPAALVLLLAGWAIFGLVLIVLFRFGPFGRPSSGRWLAGAVVAMTVLALAAQAGFGATNATALYFYAGVTAARLGSERVAVASIALVALAAAVGTMAVADDWADGVTVGVTVATICLTVFALSALGRTNRALQAARLELADLAVAEERTRIARDLHDTLGHSLSLIALKSELARRVLPDDPERAATEIGDVERVAREALSSVRDTVSGYRQPTLAMELAGARVALSAAGIDGEVEPAPDDLPRDVDAVLGWAVREGVTNVLRHSDAGRARIRVIVGGGVRAVEVEDDGSGGGRVEPAGDGTQAAGMGLAGLSERATALGGSLEAGPMPGRGFRLRVAVPDPSTSGGPAT